jgi:hypothetical protein
MVHAKIGQLCKLEKNVQQNSVWKISRTFSEFRTIIVTKFRIHPIRLSEPGVGLVDHLSSY